MYYKREQHTNPKSNPYGLKDGSSTADVTAWTSAGLQPTTGYYPYDPTLAAYGLFQLEKFEVQCVGTESSISASRTGRSERSVDNSGYTGEVQCLTHKK
ncbi:hypothetical protein B566_EDAN004134 [Ephemera danica]|nr:hypothetical protein B566_EDAN004134 [Ephemera danica]